MKYVMGFWDFSFENLKKGELKWLQRINRKIRRAKQYITKACPVASRLPGIASLLRELPPPSSIRKLSVVNVDSVHRLTLDEPNAGRSHKLLLV